MGQDENKTLNEIGAVLSTSDLSLRSHQHEGVQFLLQCFNHGHGTILADEMGLGKTCQSVVTLVALAKLHNVRGPHLVVCPLSVLETWETEIKRFGCNIIRAVVYRGTKEERALQRRDWISVGTEKRQWNVFLTTYEMIVHDAEYFLPLKWQCVIVDEAHRVKNSESLLHKQLRQSHFDWLLLLTGTPVQNNMQELYSLLCLVAPKDYPLEKRAPFLKNFENSSDKSAMAELRQILGEYMLRRTKDVVALDIPEKSEVILYHGISEIQKKLYKAILIKNYDAFETTSSLNRTSLMNALMQLRKCVAHPYLFDGVEPEPFEEGEHLITASDKLLVLDHVLKFLKHKSHRVLLFSQMTRVLDVLQDYLTFRGYSYERLDGSVRGEERFAAVRQFNAAKSRTFVFLLSTRAGGLGLTLTSADTVIFFDSDFNPQNDIQAAARAHRIGQDKPVKIIRFIGRNTVEEVIQSRAAGKLRLTDAVIGDENTDANDVNRLTAAELTEILCHGLKKLTTDDGSDEQTKINGTAEQITEHLTKILGDTDKTGHWATTQISTMPNATPTTLDERVAEEHSIYYFDGKDYSQIRHQIDKDENTKVLADRAALQLLLDEGRPTFGQTPAARKRAPRKPPTDLIPLPRVTLSPEEQAIRRQKLAEAAERRRAMLEERRRQLAEQKQKRIREKWAANGYISRSLDIPDDVEEEQVDIDLNADARLHFVFGSVAQPKCTGDALVLHCIDNSGQWGSGGVFAAINANYPRVRQHYELATQMQDVKLGDAHLVQVDDKLAVVLCIAQDKKHRDRLNIDALQSALKRVAAYVKTVAQEKSLTVHVARIGYGMPTVRWYTIERMLQRQLCRVAGAHTYVYYYRKGDSGGAQSSSSSSASSTSKDDSTSAPSDAKRSRMENDTNMSGSASASTCTTPQSLTLHLQLFDNIRLYIESNQGKQHDAKRTQRLKRLFVTFGGELVDRVQDATHVLNSEEQQPPVGDVPRDAVIRSVSIEQLESAIKNRTKLVQM